MRRLIPILAVLVALPLQTAAAQEAGLVPGARVRAFLKYPCRRSIESGRILCVAVLTVPVYGPIREVSGTVVSVSPDTLLLDVAGQADPLRLPLDWVARFAFVDAVAPLGARVRVTAPSVGLESHVGILTRLDADVLVVGTTPVAVEQVTRLEVSRGKQSNWSKGAGIGALVGGGLGALGILTADDSPSGDLSREFAPFIIGGGFFGGLLVGGILGALIPDDQWQQVPLDRLRVGITPQRDGRVALGASVRF